MHHLAWVMFWKAIFLAIVGVIGERYVAYRNRRRSEGVVRLKYDPKKDTHVADDGFARFEFWGRKGLWTAAIAMYVIGGLVFFLFIYP